MKLYELVHELEQIHPGRHFTPDGHMVGSLGELVELGQGNVLNPRPACPSGLEDRLVAAHVGFLGEQHTIDSQSLSHRFFNGACAHDNGFRHA